MKAMLETVNAGLRKHGMPTNYTDRLMSDMRKAKSKIDEVLGLTPDNLFRAAIPLEKEEAEVRKDYPLTYAAIAHILNEAIRAEAPITLGSIALIKNEVKVKGQATKLSKVLAKYLPTNEAVIETCFKELGITKAAQFLPKLGDIVKPGRQLIISTNLSDFLTASDNASFRSCHSYDGEHYNGNFAYARDKHTIITFVTESKNDPLSPTLYKIGRSWLFMAGKYLFQPKSYGAYNEFERLQARLYIEERLAKHYGIEDRFSIKHGMSLDEYEVEDPSDNCSGEAMYLDNYGMDVIYPKGTFKEPKITFAAALCMECGVTTSNTMGARCGRCDGDYTCSACGEGVAEDDVRWGDGEPFCHRCFMESYFECHNCGETYRKEDALDIHGGGQVCAHCAKSYYVECDVCEELVRKENIKSLDGVGDKVCNSCAAKYNKCSSCGKYHPLDDLMYSKFTGSLCSSCKKDKSFTCPDCGELFLKDWETEHEGKVCCIACKAKKEGREESLTPKPKYPGLPDGWFDLTEVIG